MKKDPYYFISQAIELATENVTSLKGGPFGALVVLNNKIIATGTNLVTSQHDPTAHAEIVAIRNACRYLNSFQLTDCEIYSSCEPCPMCLGAVYWARPKKLYFAARHDDASRVGFDDSFIYKEFSLPLNQRTIPTEHIIHDDLIKPFQKWNELSQKTEY